MFPPAAASSSSSSGMLNQVLVDSREIIAASTSHMRFNLQPSSPLPPLGFSPYNPSADLSHTRDQRLQSFPPDHTYGGRSDQTGTLPVQRSSSSMWAWTEEGGLRSKGSQAEGEQQHVAAAAGDKISKHNNNSTASKDIGNGLLVGSTRMKKVKARRKVREPRFSFKTMSEVDVLDDGYKWRKYGQKVVKNTQHPRSYYRCTQDNCRVKKRVERLAEDPRMVITTYEGRHAHSPSPEEDEASGKANFFWL